VSSRRWADNALTFDGPHELQSLPAPLALEPKTLGLRSLRLIQSEVWSVHNYRRHDIRGKFIRSSICLKAPELKSHGMITFRILTIRLGCARSM
jgi:hypothetical protein